MQPFSAGLTLEGPFQVFGIYKRLEKTGDSFRERDRMENNSYFNVSLLGCLIEIGR